MSEQRVHPDVPVPMLIYELQKAPIICAASLIYFCN